MLEVLIGFVSGPGIRRGDLPGAGAKPAPDALHDLVVRPGARLRSDGLTTAPASSRNSRG